MKIRILLVLLLLDLPVVAQVNDLISLVNGVFSKSIIVYDQDEKVFGYLLVYNHDISKTELKTEYIFLDKNLNKASSGEFTEPYYKTKSFLYTDSLRVEYERCYCIDQKLILERKYTFISLSSSSITTFELGTTFQSLKANSKELYFDADSIIVFDKSVNTLLEKTKILKLNKFELSQVKAANVVSLFAQNYAGFCRVSDKSMEFVDISGVSRNCYKFPPNTPDGIDMYGVKYVRNHIVYVEKNTIKVDAENRNNLAISGLFLSTSAQNFLQFSTRKLLAINLENGKLIWEKILYNAGEGLERDYYIKNIGDQTYIMGSLFGANDKQGTVRYSLSTSFGSSVNPGKIDFNDLERSNSSGLYLCIISGDGKALTEKSLRWADLSQIEIDKAGLNDRKYKLIPKDFFLFKSGKISVLTEKRNIQTNSETAGMVVLNFDLDFQISSINNQLSEKSKNNFTDYLFSQYSLDGNTASYFNIIKEKGSLFLGINTMIDGVLKSEKIKISNDDKNSVIIPYPAKEGYILLNEINKKNRKNEFRLEKLNL